MSENTSIEITVGPDGVLSYSDKGKTLLHASLADTVTWICGSHDYAIKFENDAWPFHGQSPVALSIMKKKKERTGPLTAKHHGHVRRYFKYTVSVFDDAGKRLILDDPIIIVDDE